MSTRVSRHFVTVGGRQFHYRRAGQGPVLLMLHISPMSSRTFAGAMERLADRFTIIAPDRPGYGSSDPLECEVPEVADYAVALREALDAMGVDRMLVYGRATGTIIAVEFARQNPDRVEALVLENLAVVGEEQRKPLIDRFAPSFAPEWDGSHLLRAWCWWRDFNVFWPWFDRRLATRLDVDIATPASTHEDTMDTLRAGAGYHLAPDALFRYNPLPALGELKMPITVFARQSAGGSGGASIEWLNRLLPHAPSVNVERYAIEPYMMAHQLDPDGPTHMKYLGQLREMFEGAAPAGAAPSVVDAAPIAGGISRTYVATADGDILVRRAGDGRGRPIVLLHDFSRSSASLTELATALGKHRPVLAPDLAGFGESDPLPAGAARSIAAYAGQVGAVLDACGAGEVDVYGIGAGALVASELAAHDPRVKNTILDSVALLDDGERDALSAGAATSLEPSSDGTHLIRAWSRVRDATLFWPGGNRSKENIRWEEPADPGALHEQVMDLLKGYAEDGAAQRAALDDPVVERLRGLSGRKLVAFRQGSGARFERLAEELGRDAGAGDATVRPLEDADEAAQVFESFLEQG